jgi:mono/diheme cytochrome c family protein
MPLGVGSSSAAVQPKGEFVMKRFVTLLSALAIAAAPAFAADKKIERLWKAKCGSCHGADGKGETEKGKKMKTADLSAAEWQKKATDADITKAINEGVKLEKDGVKKEMDAYNDLTDEQKAGLVAFIRELKK